MNSILLIDDEPELLNTSSRTLSEAGFTVLTAASGKEAIELVGSAGPDLVITDLLMPDMDGLELIMQLRESAPGLRIIAMSGGARVGSLDLLPVAAKLGARSVLSKPYSGRELLSAVRDALAD